MHFDEHYLCFSDKNYLFSPQEIWLECNSSGISNFSNSLKNGHENHEKSCSHSMSCCMMQKFDFSRNDIILSKIDLQYSGTSL